MISLNPTIDRALDLGLLNSLFSAFWISANINVGLLMENLMYHVSMRSCGVGGWGIHENPCFINLTILLMYHVSACSCGVGGWGIRGNPCFINLTTLCGEACVASLLSLRGGSINGLYSGPVFALFLKEFPLHVAPNIKVDA